MKDMNSLMRQAQAMQAKLQEAQAKLAVTVFEGSAGNGLVKLSLTGAGELGAVMIDPQLLDPDDPETLADLIVAAHADAKRQSEEAQAAAMRQTMGPLAGALPPGMKF